MPMTQGDLALARTAGIVNNGAGPSASVWQFPYAPAQSILNFQTVPSHPNPGGTTTSTGLLTPDLLLRSRLRNFSPEVFDLSPDSALIHFMQALLGDTGVGQLRKRQMMARLQESLCGTQFYDLDAFYGALFGALRGPAGALPINPSTNVPVSPYTDLASPDGWDDILAADAKFRERIIQLAQAITLGGTVAGLRAVAEAISGVKCHVYETWRVIDSQGPQTGSVTASSLTNYSQQNLWSQLQAQYANWSAIGGYTWFWLQGFTTVVLTPGVTTSYTPPLGGLGINCRSEVVVMPRKQYALTPAGQRQEGADFYGIASVLEVLRPANAVLSVASEAVEYLTTIPIATAYADSEFWEVTYTVTPPVPTDPCYGMSRGSYQHGGNPPGSSWSCPRPPDCRGQGTQISYAGEVTATWAQGVWVEPSSIFSVPPGRPSGKAPNVDGMPLSQGLTTLENAGFGIVHVSYEYSNLAADEIEAYMAFPIYSYTQHGTSVSIGLYSPIVGAPSYITQYQNGQVVDQHDYEIETFGGQTVSYYPQRALMDAVRATSARTSGAQGLKAAPYAGPRMPVKTHG